MSKPRIPVAEPELGEQELKNVTVAIKSGWVSSKGEFIERFEKGFANYVGTRHGVSTCNGTTALHLALVCLGVGKGDEVIVPSLTFVAVPNAVIYTGAKPVFVDSHPAYWCMDPQKIRKKISKKTKAIIPVHLYGHPCEMTPILEIAKEKGVYLIEDCAEAHGAEYKNRKVGCFGDISCFSFYGNKILTTGEGGMCLTDSSEYANSMKILRDHGMNPKKRYWHDFVGFNYRMTNLQAALGVAQLERIESTIRRKTWLASVYKEVLGKINNVTLAPEMPWARTVYWLYSILLRGVNRDRIMLDMDEAGVETRPFFYPAHKLPPYKTKEELIEAERLSKHGMNLPSSTKLSENEVLHVCDSLKRALVQQVR